jgi:hypothetical protein
MLSTASVDAGLRVISYLLRAFDRVCQHGSTLFNSSIYRHNRWHSDKTSEIKKG